MPVAHLCSMITTNFVYVSHCYRKKARRIHSGCLVFLNCDPIMRYIKLQQNVGSSEFTSEIILMKSCVDTIYGLRFKLHMFGITVHKVWTTYIFSDR